jgi:hypothetical protein
MASLESEISDLRAKLFKASEENLALRQALRKARADAETAAARDEVWAAHKAVSDYIKDNEACQSLMESLIREKAEAAAKKVEQKIDQAASFSVDSIRYAVHNTVTTARAREALEKRAQELIAKLAEQFASRVVITLSLKDSPEDVIVVSEDEG